jgi:hypothetical protein
MMTILALQSICVNMRSVSTIVTLQGVATRLGFKSLAQLYLYYARYFTWSDLRNRP